MAQTRTFVPSFENSHNEQEIDFRALAKQTAGVPDVIVLGTVCAEYSRNQKMVDREEDSLLLNRNTFR